MLGEALKLNSSLAELNFSRGDMNKERQKMMK